MVDCGSFYSKDDETETVQGSRPRALQQALPAAAANVQALFLTHAHTDHIGRVPLLVRQGYRGAIYLTRASAELAPIMLENAVRYEAARIRTWSWSVRARRSGKNGSLYLKIHWNPTCEWAGRIKSDNRRTFRGTLHELTQHLRAAVSPCKVCARLEVAPIAGLFHVLPYERRVPLAANVAATLLDAGHIPGSASILFEIGDGNDPLRVLFSGDLGNDNSPLIRGPGSAPPVDAVFVEATYGSMRRTAVAAEERGRFRRAVTLAVAKGGIAWIPAFALDRTQKILHEVLLAKKEGLMPGGAPIFCPSPTANRITEIYRRNRNSGWFRPGIQAMPAPWSPAGLSAESPSAPPLPSILITTSGMMDVGLSRSLAPKLLKDPGVTVFLVGYQSPSSPGGRISRGDSLVEIDGNRVPVRARVEHFGAFSAHGDARDIDRWLSRVPHEAAVFLVHCERASCQARRRALEAVGFKNVQIPEPGVVQAIRRAGSSKSHELHR